MLVALRVVGSALAQVLTHFSASLLANLVAMMFSIPVVVGIGALAFGTHSFSVVPLGVALLVGVLPNPCTAGVQAVAHGLANDDYVTFQGHWDGFKQYARLATIAWVLSLLVTIVILANLLFYARAVGTGTGILGTLALPLFLVWAFVFVVWLAVHLFVFPLLIQQQVKSLHLVYRNAFLMAIARPSVVMLTLPLWICVLLLGSATGLVTFIGLALSASIQHNATAKLLPTFKLRNVS